jgi:hypothetical protein
MKMIYHHLPYLLEQNYLNPFNSTTTIAYRIPGREQIVLKICDVPERKTAALVNAKQTWK